ncbi:MAG: radical SAM family heme chaperone HemW [Canibacter sp.]
MPSVLPVGDPVPSDGSLPAQAREGANNREFAVYVHVPYCRVRCGYCDFNTYTAEDLGTTNRAHYASEAAEEVSFGAEVLRRANIPERDVHSVFFGGGTPTLLPAEDLAGVLERIRAEWGIQTNAEVTTEANPDSVDFAYLEKLAQAGFTRVSFGMQSAVPSVLKTLDRTHTPERVPQVVQWAKDAGLQVSLDLIYGAPGETLNNWKTSVETALACEPDHISAYALIIEEGTKLASQIKRGRVAAPDDDLQADMYEFVDQTLEDADYHWYEISNWSRTESTRSTHNLSYWKGDDWWGVGPGAHSHVGGVRWWNVKHPRAYAERIRAGVTPAHSREILDAEARRVERILLETRIRDGLDTATLSKTERARVPELISEGLIEGKSAIGGRLIPTRRGRLLADTVIHHLLGSVE